MTTVQGNWPPNLLARIATTIGRRHQEEVASAALLYVIQADSHARRAVVADLARRAGLTVGAELPDDLFFAGQDHGEGGRPDIVGVDDRTGARVVIEAKVDAGFQPRQMARYSTRLAPGWPSVIAVLAPKRRLPRLLDEAHQQLTGEEIELAERGPVTWQTADRALTLLGISWLETLEVMENVTVSADLSQLRGFYDYLESGVFLPFATADLARANGRLMRSVTSVAQNVARAASLPPNAAAQRITGPTSGSFCSCTGGLHGSACGWTPGRSAKTRLTGLPTTRTSCLPREPPRSYRS